MCRIAKLVTETTVFGRQQDGPLLLRKPFYPDTVTKALMFPHSTYDDPLAAKFRQFVKSPGFPCVGAKSALTKGQLQFAVARDLTSPSDDARLYRSLLEFVSHYRATKALFQSFVVIFRASTMLSERAFERHLWQRLQSLTDLDAAFGHPPDHRVSSDPRSPHFSLSFGGEAFFAVGLHPNASRPARRFSYPTIVLNPHDQFEELRRQNVYGKMRKHILEKEIALSGSVNPMLREFGEASEAPQYSGRIVDDGWKCPFRRK